MALNFISLAQINWNGQDWAFQCDFDGNDIERRSTEAPLCGPTCLGHVECTHFTWNTYLGGSCWLKRGKVSKEDAFRTNDPTMVCGVVHNKDTPDPGPDLVINDLAWSTEFESESDLNEWNQETGGYIFFYSFFSG